MGQEPQPTSRLIVSEARLCVLGAQSGVSLLLQLRPSVLTSGTWVKRHTFLLLRCYASPLSGRGRAGLRESQAEAHARRGLG